MTIGEKVAALLKQQAHGAPVSGRYIARRLGLGDHHHVCQAVHSYNAKARREGAALIQSSMGRGGGYWMERA
jgi:predicted Zn-ribbon and HTH transcriptional regulator